VTPRKNGRPILLYVVMNHVKVIAFMSQKLLPVTDGLAVWTAKPAAKASDQLLKP